MKPTKHMHGIGRVATFAALAMLPVTGTNAQSPTHSREHGIFGLVGDRVISQGVTASAANLPTGFSITPVITGLTYPTVVRFSPDGRIFVAEKSGRVKVFDSLADTTPDVPVDLSAEVYSWWDRGLLGMALHPGFPTTPYVYLLYAWDIVPYGDTCPGNPGANADGCMANGRLARVEIDANNQLVGEPLIMLGGNWCQQFPSHSTGSLEFGPAGALYVSAGDGGSFTQVDYGQLGGTLPGPITPRNPCGDPPGGVGGPMDPPTAEGGALRAQDLQTSGDPVTFDGSILRVDPATGAAWPTNPLIGGDPADDRTIAWGFRNPFRITVTNDGKVWIGDVGWGTWEEIDVIPDPDLAASNFGWPCMEGNGPQPSYNGTNLTICEDLYASGNHVAPLFTYQHGVPLEACPPNPGVTSAITGVAFYEGSAYPSDYQGALFFTDYSRRCVWVMHEDAGGSPDPSNITLFATQAPSVGLYQGPSDDIFSVDLIGGTINRITFDSGNQAPTAVAAATPTSGAAPLAVQFDGSGSSDPEGDPLAYAWDLDGDGAFDDAATETTSFTYDTDGTYTAALEVSDGQGGGDTDAVTITVDPEPNTPPTAIISAPSDSLLWSAGETIAFSGSWTDDQDTQYPASAMTWTVVIHHCAADNPSDCHIHPLSTFPGVDSGTFVAPDHEYPSYLEVTLDVTDSDGLTDSATVDIHPQTVVISFDTVPSTLALAVGSRQVITPIDIQMIHNGQTTITALTPQNLGGALYVFESWSDGGAASHAITALVDQNLIATYNGQPEALAVATPTGGVEPLTVNFDGSGSSDPEGNPLTYEWDLDGDSQYDDGTGATTSFTYTADGTYAASLRVTDDRGGVDTDTVTITVEPNTPPTAIISGPPTSLLWSAGETIAFSGSWTDDQDTQYPASAMTWTLKLHYCAPDNPSDCHTQLLNTFPAVDSGTFVAPDHEYPAHLELILTVTDSGGLTDSATLALQPQTVLISFDTVPSNLALEVGSRQVITPIDIQMIHNGQSTITAPSPQIRGGVQYEFDFWSDGGAASHVITALVGQSLIATYNRPPVALLVATPQRADIGETVFLDATGSSDADGDTLHFAWYLDEDGDGVFDDGPDSPTITHVFTNNGSYFVTVRVEDGHGGVDIHRFKIRVVYPSDNTAPTAVAIAKPQSGSAPLTVAFNGSGSSDSDGDPLTYDWDLDADGAYDDATGVNTSYVYGTNGVYLAGLQVSDGRGGVGTDSIGISVGNIPPTAAVLATPTWGDAPLAVSFDGSGSRDPEGGTLTYEWDLDGDGQYDDAFTPATTFTYAADGTYTASLRVSDDHAQSDIESVSIDVDDPSSNNAPDARLVATPQRADIGETVFLDATGSSDADGDTLHFAWDLDEDGDFDDGPDAPTMNHVFNSNGSYFVRVRVDDGHGGVDIDDFKVRVVYPWSVSFGERSSPEPHESSDPRRRVGAGATESSE